jgi:hypothetical protein
MSGFMYFGRTANGFIKIGFSVTPERRRRELRYESNVVTGPIIFVDWFTLPLRGGRRDEIAFHSRFPDDAALRHKQGAACRRATFTRQVCVQRCDS